MSKRDRRRDQAGSWQDAPAPTLNLEEAFVEGFGIKERRSEQHNDAIIPAENGTFQFRGLTLTKTGIDSTTIPGDLAEEDWVDAVRVLREVDEAVQWAVGDLVNHASSRWGEKYTEYAEATGYAEKTLREYAYVARSVHLSIRMDKLSFGHHQLVASLRDESGNPQLELQAQWLQRATENKWSVAALRAAINNDKLLSAGNVEMDWPFAKTRIPNMNALQRLWSQAAQGDKKARAQFKRKARELHTWLRDAEKELDEAFHRSAD